MPRMTREKWEAIRQEQLKLQQQRQRADGNDWNNGDPKSPIETRDDAIGFLQKAHCGRRH